MNNIFRGERVSTKEFLERLNGLSNVLKKDLLLEPLSFEIVIEAANTLALKMKPEVLEAYLVYNGMTKWKARSFIQVTMDGLKREELKKKVFRELGEKPFEWKIIEEGIEEKEQPYGVLMHIGAGNAIGLSALSVLEGLLSGNINILKLPSYEGGISVELLMQLIQIEPRLKPYIYVLDISSSEKEALSQVAELADALVVWGSDETIAGIRQLAPPYLPIIEWGHRISFAYFTRNDRNEKDLDGLALDICISDQQYCSSPQCVFYETDDKDELNRFAYRLAKHIEQVSLKYPPTIQPKIVEAQITWTQELVKMDEILGEKKLIKNQNLSFSVMIDYKAKLKASPLFRNIWVMPIKREDIIDILRDHKGHLQTVGLSCNKKEEEKLSNIFYAAGVNRINACGEMSDTYSGEPHDGFFTLRKYIRKVSRRLKGSISSKGY